jgi:predicted GNAT family acetyltransferase
MSNIIIRNNPERSRFEVVDSDKVIGQAAYKEYEAGEAQRIFYHTVIDDEYGGQGLAARLATQALDETVADGITIVPVCPYIKKFLTKHPEYGPNTTKPTPAHLEFLSAVLARR